MPKITPKVQRIRRAQQLGDAKDVGDATEELTKSKYSEAKIIKQIEDEYQTAYRFMRPKIREGLSRLKLYNNQKRDKTKVGDPMLFTNHQTVLAALYDDKLGANFGGREEGDEDMGENLNILAEFDHTDMWKATHDYEWDFDTLAFGRGLSYFDHFDIASKTPIPVVWDPLTFLRDPNAKSVRGNRLGQGALHFGGREVTLSISELKNNPEYRNLSDLNAAPSDNFSLIFEANQARSQAQGLANPSTLLGVPGSLTVLQWLTIIEGQYCMVELANNRKRIIRIHVYEDSTQYFKCLIDRPCYPISHDWDGVSVFDIVEDKQRFRASLLNIQGMSAMADLYPMYFYDATKIDKSIDKSFGFNKFIPVNGPVGDAAHPLIKSQPSAQSNYIMQFLDTAAQRALATPELKQGVPSSGDRTLGELNLVSSSVDARYSLTARIWSDSEKRFWARWYEIYERDFDKDLHRKVARLVGAFGPQWRDITRDKIIMGNPLGPDIEIESKIVSEAKKQRTSQQLGNFYATIVAGDPTADIRYFKRKAARLLFPKDEVDRMFPPTPDELEATEENESLNKGESVRVLADQDHVTHLRVLAAAKDGPEKDAHQKAHLAFITAKRAAPQEFTPMPSDGAILPQIPGQETKPNATTGQPIIKAPEGAIAP